MFKNISKSKNNWYQEKVSRQLFKKGLWDFPRGAVVRNPPVKAGDTGSSPGQEDPTCCGATRPVRHNYWAREPQLLKPTCLEPVLHNERPPQWEARAPQRRAAPARHN